jgi:hypothetical protein
MTPVICSVTVEGVWPQPSLELDVRFARSGFEDVEYKVCNADCRNSRFCLRIPRIQSVREVLLSYVVDQPDNVTFFIHC